MNRARLKGVQTGAVRSLSGFIRGSHTVPDGQNDATMRFVKKAGSADVSERLDQVYRELKDVLGYKRKDLVSVDDMGAASIKTPDFDVNIWIEQDPDAAAKYCLYTETTSFRSIEVLRNEMLQQVFSKHCNTFIVDFDASLDLEEKISQIEDIENLDGKLVDERDGSAFTLTLNSPPLRLRVTSADLSISLTSGSGLKSLIDYSMDVLEKMTNEGVRVLPSPGAS